MQIKHHPTNLGISSPTNIQRWCQKSLGGTFTNPCIRLGWFEASNLVKNSMALSLVLLAETFSRVMNGFAHVYTNMISRCRGFKYVANHSKHFSAGLACCLFRWVKEAALCMDMLDPHGPRKLPIGSTWFSGYSFKGDRFRQSCQGSQNAKPSSFYS